MTAGLYLTRVIAVRIIAVVIGLAALAIAIDLLDNATDVIAQRGSAMLPEYALLRLPLVLIRVLPICMLIGGVLGFLTLALRSELVVLRAAGLNNLRMMLILLPLSLGLGLAQNLLTSWIGPYAERALTLRFPEVSHPPHLDREMWLRDWGAVIRIGSADPGARVLHNLSVFQLDSVGRLDERIDAEKAVAESYGWLLTGVTLNLPKQPPKTLTHYKWKSRLTPAGVISSAQKSDMTDAGQVRQILSGRMPGGRGIPFYTMRYWTGYATFLTPMVMLVFASLAGYGLARSGGAARNVTIAGAAGIAFILVNGVFNSLGEVGAVSAVWAAFIAPVIFLMLGVWTVMLVEE